MNGKLWVGLVMSGYAAFMLFGGYGSGGIGVVLIVGIVVLALGLQDRRREAEKPRGDQPSGT